MNRRFTKLTALLLALLMVLCACGQEDIEPVVEPTDEPLTLTIRAGDAQSTLDPALCTADGSEMILYHMFENLMRWEDDGNGFATMVPGQATGYTVELDYAGNATYTFTLRDDIFWSDGKEVTAHHFAAAWKRIADPATLSPHRELLSVISGYDQVQASGNPDLLGVSASDDRTLVVSLKGNPPYFLEEICAGAFTMPVRSALIENRDSSIVSNGAYDVENFSSGRISLVKSETYYAADTVTVQTIKFLPRTNSESDYETFLSGAADLVESLPLSALQELSASESWSSESVTTTGAVMLNTLIAPFDSADVRAAFRLAIDEQALVDALGDLTSRPAIGLVPYGVTDYGVRTEKVETEPQTDAEFLPDPNAPVEEIVEKPVTYWDFRAHSREIVTLNTGSDYATDCSQAKELLAGAGYAGGIGFPAVEYIYVNTPDNKAVAETLCTMWKEQLGVNVTARGLTQEEYDLLLVPVEGEDGLVAAPFQMAAIDLSASYNDAGALLNRWHSTAADNCTGYASAAFDILLGAAKEAVSPESYDAYLHDAEAILLQDAPVIPLYYHGGSYRLADGLEGLYRSPNGVYFLSGVTRSPVETQ